MTSNLKDIHIGEIIEKKLKEMSKNDKNITISKLAKDINCDRTTIYDIFKRKSIDTEKLVRISNALNYDFLNEVYIKNTTFKDNDKEEYSHFYIRINKNMVEVLKERLGGDIEKNIDFIKLD